MTSLVRKNAGFYGQTFDVTSLVRRKTFFSGQTRCPAVAELVETTEHAPSAVAELVETTEHAPSAVAEPVEVPALFIIKSFLTNTPSAARILRLKNCLIFYETAPEAGFVEN